MAPFRVDGFAGTIVTVTPVIVSVGQLYVHIIDAAAVPLTAVLQEVVRSASVHFATFALVASLPVLSCREVKAILVPAALAIMDISEMLSTLPTPS